MPMRSPRSRPMARSDRPQQVRSRGSACARRCGARRAASRPMTASAVTDLPQPLSPTRQCVSPRRTVQVDARAPPRCAPKRTRRPATSSTAAQTSPAGAEQVAQPVAEQVDAQHQHEQRDARHHDHPGVEEHVVLALGDHQPPARQRRRHAEAEEGQHRLEQDRQRHLQRRDHDQVVARCWAGPRAAARARSDAPAACAAAT